MTEDYYKRSLEIHKKLHGKIGVINKLDVKDRDDLSIVYTPGVAEPCRVIADDPSRARDLTIKGNSVAVVTDGSAVLGLGNIGPLAALPVMEGKALLFKKYADIDAWPICLDTQDVDSIVETVRLIAPGFGAINLEDIAAPRCFAVEQRLQALAIPVFHDDQDGTAIVTMAALINACRVLGRTLSHLRIVICGAGAAGTAIARLLCEAEIIVVDSKGTISGERTDLSECKRGLLEFTNPKNMSGTLRDAIRDADAFIGVSQGGLLTAEDIMTMNADPIIFAMANPEPEIMPEEALRGGAAIIGTGRSDFPNQINNVLVFPGIFRGALDSGASSITYKMKLAAVHALADMVKNPDRNKIIPDLFDTSVVATVAKAVALHA